jgi:hypothetical protein
MARKYYTLIVRVPGETWSPQFGDWSRAIVAQEKGDTRKDWARGTEFKIITTNGKQKAITEAIREINYGIGPMSFAVVKDDFSFASQDTIQKAWDAAIDGWKGIPTSNRPYYRAQAMEAMISNGFNIQTIKPTKG